MKIIITLVMLLTAYVATAQTTNNFDHTWTRIKLDTISGQVYFNSMPQTIVVRTDQKQLLAERTFFTGDPNRPEVVYNDKYALNGEPFLTTTTENQAKKATYKKQSTTNGFTLEWTKSEPGQPSKLSYGFTEEWSLSFDGKILTILKTYKSFTDSNNYWSAKGTYSRE